MDALMRALALTIAIRLIEVGGKLRREYFAQAARRAHCVALQIALCQNELNSAHREESFLAALP